MVLIKWDRYLDELDYFLINEEVEDIFFLKFVMDGRLVLVVVDEVDDISYFFMK